MIDDELIDRARRGEADDAELAELEAWRRAAAENERHYRATLRILDVGRSLATTEALVPRPSSSELIARVASRRRFAVSATVARWAPWAIAAAAAIVATVTLRSRAVETQSIPGWGSAEVVTGASELATVQLGEGSVVRLGPSSRLRVIPGRERAVHLQGRAFFAVQRMPQHPLRIHTAAGDARVLGTRFELATNDSQLELRVVEGRVALSTAHDRVEVAAGQETKITAGSVERPTPVPAPAAVAGWVGKFLAFQATPLSEAAREIERVYGTPVAISDSTLGRETITATFTDRPVREVVNVVCAVLNAHCTVENDHVRIDR